MAQSHLSPSRNHPSPCQAEFESELEKLQPATSTPGYWETLADNCAQWAQEVTVCPFWRAASEAVTGWTLEFRKSKGGSLLTTDELPKFQGKGAERIREKLWHIACKCSPPRLESIMSPTCALVPAINDLVRTRVQCQFLDGVEFFVGKLVQLAESMGGLKPTRERKGRLEGYFAQHFYFESSVFYRFGGGEQAARITCEVQAATQLSTRIWDESHPTYEKWRGQDDAPEDWQWNPNDPRFLARQLGHMIHLADGILVQLRDSVPRTKGKTHG